MHTGTRTYNDAQAAGNRAICRLLATQIDRHLPWDYKNLVRRKGRLQRLK